MPSYHLSSKADDDIDDIVDYTLETWGESQTHSYVTELYQFLQTLADNPGLGRSASEFAAPLKRYNYKAHTIFYEPTRKGVQRNDYAYDQLNRIKVFQGNAETGASPGESYSADYSYDRNGNLATLNRRTVTNTGTVVDMDQLTYEYNTETRIHPVSKIEEKVKLNNQLVRVDDGKGDTGFNDLDTQPAMNYEYDEIGQLTEDKAEKITKIDWRVDGKVRTVTKNIAGEETNITFQYDGLGNRISKTVVEENKTTLYARDAQGNVLAVYDSNSNGAVEPPDEDDDVFRKDNWILSFPPITQKIAYEAFDFIILENTAGDNIVEPDGGDLRLTATNSITLRPNFHAKAGSTFLAEIKEVVPDGGGQEGLFLTENHIYGSSRLGMEQKNLEITEVAPTEPVVLFENRVGDKRYELSNHLGNVLSVVTDRKTGSTDDYSPDVVAYNDYYPFGMLLPNRHANTSDYRYGFQGQELDNEIKGEGNSLNYKYRMHDPKVGRFFAVDPLSPKYPHYTPYSFSGNRVIAAVELEGLEEAWLFDSEQRTSLIQTAKNLKPQGKNILHYEFYKSAFKLTFDHEIPKKLIDHYTDLKAIPISPLTLTEEGMKAINPYGVSIVQGIKTDRADTENKRFNDHLKSLGLGESKFVELSVGNHTRTHGTLGEFTVKFDGVLTKGNTNSEWTFKGTMEFMDIWDFDKKEGEDRSTDSEIFTKIGRVYLLGQGFPVNSVKIPIEQSHNDTYVDWFDNNTFKDHPNPFVKFLNENPSFKKLIFDKVKDEKEEK